MTSLWKLFVIFLFLNENDLIVKIFSLLRLTLLYICLSVVVTIVLFVQILEACVVWYGIGVLLIDIFLLPIRVNDHMHTGITIPVWDPIPIWKLSFDNVQGSLNIGPPPVLSGYNTGMGTGFGKPICKQRTYEYRHILKQIKTICFQIFETKNHTFTYF